MSDPTRNTENAPLDSRVQVVAVIVVLAALYVLLQHTRFAPFPHAADDFVGGLGVGVAIGGVFLWLRGRR